MKKKTITTDDLAVMIQAGFDNTATKADISKIEGRLSIVETKLDKALYTSISNLEGRVRRIEEKIGINK